MIYIPSSHFLYCLTMLLQSDWVDRLPARSLCARHHKTCVECQTKTYIGTEEICTLQNIVNNVLSLLSVLWSGLTAYTHILQANVLFPRCFSLRHKRPDTPFYKDCDDSLFGCNLLAWKLFHSSAVKVAKKKLWNNLLVLNSYRQKSLFRATLGHEGNQEVKKRIWDSFSRCDKGESKEILQEY